MATPLSANLSRAALEGPPVIAPTPTPRQAAATVAAKTTSSLQQYLNYLSTNMGRLAGNQATAEINAQTTPLLAGLDKAAASGQAAINGYTQQFAGELAKIAPNVAGAYSTAENQQSALDTALAAELRNAGGSAAQDLTNTLQARGQDTSVAAQATQTGNGLAGASYATGSAGLGNLIARGAAANAYGAELPGLAALSGLQATKGLQSDVANQRAAIISDAQAQYPTLANQAFNQLLGQQRNALTEQGQQITQQKNQQAAAATTQKLKQSAQLAQLADQIKQQTANTGTVRANNTAAYQQGQLGLGAVKVKIAAQNAATAAQSVQVRAAHNAATEAIAAQKASKGSTLTAAQTTKLVEGWTNGKTGSVRVPVLDKKGKPVTNAIGVPQYVTQSQTTGQVDYSGQIRALVAAGLTQSQAAAAVNAANAPGSNGRPWGALAASAAAGTVKLAAQAGQTIQQARAAMVKAGLPTDVIEKAIKSYTGPWLPAKGK